MKKSLIVIFFTVIAFLAVSYAIELIKPGERIKITDEFNDRFTEPVLGIYDRNQELNSETVRTIQHYYLKWFDSKPSEIPDKLKSVLSGDKDIMITIEMWSNSDNNILSTLEKGDYDEKIKKLCNEISQCSRTIYLRLNPEMEAPVRSLPWQWQPPENYIRSFRHFSQLCKKTAPKSKIVWGAAGFPGDLEFWPDNEVVDIASVTLESQSELLSYKYPKGDSMPEIIKLKLHRLRFIDKPIFILGSPKVKKENFKMQWIERAIGELKKDEDIIYGPINPKVVEDYHQKDNLLIGVYDPKLTLAKENFVKVEHIFTDWASVVNGTLKKEFTQIISRNHDVILTMEPWKAINRGKDPMVLNNVIRGEYDKELKELYEIITQTKRTVYLRWAHEMEIPIERYAWQSKDPVSYIKAFRYIVNFNKERPKNIRYVWGPAGDRASIEFWPGEDVVDYISVAIYGLPDKNITDHKKQESFNDIFKRKFYRMRFLHKPIFITEFGVKGPEDYKKLWLEDAANTINKFPEVKGICYFNLSDVPEVWGEIEAPDWSIRKETFIHFVETLTQNRVAVNNN